MDHVIAASESLLMVEFKTPVAARCERGAEGIAKAGASPYEKVIMSCPAIGEKEENHLVLLFAKEGESGGVELEAAEEAVIGIELSFIVAAN